jgi:hypothetical protein
MSTTTERPEPPTQITLKGSGGAIITFDRDKITEHVQRQWDAGELQRVNPDGTPYSPRWKA